MHRYNSVDNMEKRTKQNLPQQEAEKEFDLSDPEQFRRAFIASEILNRKY